MAVLVPNVAKCRRPSSLAFAVLAVLVADSSVRGQDSDEVKRLKERIELLETKLKLAEAQNTLLQDKYERLKKESEQAPTKQPGSAKNQSLTQLLPQGKVITGTWLNTSDKNSGDITISITERDKEQVKARVVLTFKNKTPNQEYDVVGEVVGVKLTLKTIGSAITINIDLEYKGDGRLEGFYHNVTVNKRGKVGATIPK
ncbi:MAG: hypothetical protein JWO38_4129 [Gemmataceae bacterium]|nr:hypothetical protein [Gemmataceae bacterium]